MIKLSNHYGISQTKGDPPPVDPEPDKKPKK